MTYLYLSKDETPEVVYRQKVGAVVCKTLAPFLGYDVDGDAVFESSDEVERRHIEAESGAQGLAAYYFPGRTQPQILDARNDRDYTRCK